MAAQAAIFYNADLQAKVAYSFNHALKQRIRELGERLDAHRKCQQAQHPGLTLTGIYNVLEKLRAGEALNAKDRETHDQGLISVLKQLHDDLDAAVLEAYGWADLLQQQQGGRAARPFLHPWPTGKLPVPPWPPPRPSSSNSSPASSPSTTSGPPKNSAA